MSKFSEYNFKGRKALIRVDFNVPLNSEFAITDDNRMRASLPTIKKILADGGSVILMSLIGGIGTLSGPVVGAFIITGLENVLADRVGSWVTVVLGVIFVVSVLVFRQGLVGSLRRFWPTGRPVAARA